MLLSGARADPVSIALTLLIGSVTALFWLLGDKRLGILSRSRDLRRRRIFDYYEKLDALRSLQRLSADERREAIVLLSQYREHVPRPPSPEEASSQDRKPRWLLQAERIAGALGDWLGYVLMFALALGAFLAAAVLIPEFFSDGRDPAVGVFGLGAFGMGVLFAITGLREILEPDDDDGRSPSRLKTVEDVVRTILGGTVLFGVVVAPFVLLVIAVRSINAAASSTVGDWVGVAVVALFCLLVLWKVAKAWYER